VTVLQTLWIGHAILRTLLWTPWTFKWWNSTVAKSQGSITSKRFLWTLQWEAELYLPLSKQRALPCSRTKDGSPQHRPAEITLLQDLLKMRMRLLPWTSQLLETWESFGCMFKTKTSLCLPSKLKLIRVLALSDLGTQNSLSQILYQRKKSLAQPSAFAAAWSRDASKGCSNCTSTNCDLEPSLLVLFSQKWSREITWQPQCSDGSRGWWVLPATTCSLLRSSDLFRGSLLLDSW